MIFEKFIDEDLGQVSYIIGCGETKESLIVDPRRDTQDYDAFIEKNGLNLKYVFNTHTHADYIGGHLELKEKYSIVNIFQKSAPVENFEIIKVTNGDEFNIGKTLKVNILETPGHTPFDISLLLSENGIEKIVFTGDILFVGDMGRPDLLGEENLENLSNSSYESSKKLWNLSDDIIVLTSHIEGSLCGKNLSQQYFSTIGIEKKTNYTFMLSQESKEKYVDNLISQNIETPAFFKKMAGININGPKLIDSILNNIEIIEFEDIKNKDNIQIIDLREPDSFHINHIKNSINISKKSNVSLIAGNILDYEKDIYLIGGDDKSYFEFMIKLLRVGFDNIKAIINNDFSLLKTKDLTSSNIIEEKEIDNEFVNILLDKDCSKLGNTIQSNLSKIMELDLNKYKKVIFSCNFGYKSSVLSSLLKNKNIYFLKGTK